MREEVKSLENPLDELTGLYTWIHFLNFAEREFQRAQRFERSISIILIDVDNLGQINENHTRECGDQVLVEISKRCKQNIRDLDVLGCYEDGKFILLLIEVEKNNAKKVAERLRRIITARPVTTEEGAITVTVTIGVTDLSGEIKDLPSLLERAEDALFLAKKEGQNRVEVK